MVKRKISDGQGELLTFDLKVPEEVTAVVSAEEFERRRDQQMATPGSVALQQALEEEARERQLDRAVDTTGVSYDEAARRLGFRSEGRGRLDALRVAEEIRGRKEEYKNKQLPPPKDWGGSVS